MMNLKHVVIANAVVTAFFGLGFVLAPATQLKTSGAQTNAIAETMARTYGTQRRDLRWP